MRESQEHRPDNIQETLSNLSTYALTDVGITRVRDLANGVLSQKGYSTDVYPSVVEGFYDVVGIILPAHATASLLPFAKVEEEIVVTESNAAANDIVATVVALTEAYDYTQRTDSEETQANTLLTILQDENPFIQHENDTELKPDAPLTIAQLDNLLQRYTMPEVLQTAINSYVMQRVNTTWLTPEERAAAKNFLGIVAATTYAIFRRGPKDLGSEENPIGAPLPPFGPRKRQGAEAPIPGSDEPQTIGTARRVITTS